MGIDEERKGCLQCHVLFSKHVLEVNGHMDFYFNLGNSRFILVEFLDN